MASEGESLPSSSSEARVMLILRSPDPTKLKDLTMMVPLRWRVEELKQLISLEHPRRPKPEDQVLIYAGKVLGAGDAVLSEILLRTDQEAPYILHLALKREEPPLTQSVSAPNLREVPREASEAPPSSNGASPMMAVPLVMVNPIVSAAYNAALAAAYPSNAAPTGPTMRDAAQPSSSLQPTAPQTTHQQPMVPAIAFFPLGIPVLVPATAQNQGFQIGQPTAPVQQIAPQQQPQQPQQRAIDRRPPAVAPGGIELIHGALSAFRVGRRGQAAHGAHGRRGVVVYRFSLRGLIQLSLIIAVLYAYCSKEHFILGVTVFGLLYLFGRPIRRLIHYYYRARDAEGRPRVRGPLHELLAILLTLISSLFPNWNAHEGPAVPFARLVREEGEAGENRGAPEAHPHDD